MLDEKKLIAIAESMGIEIDYNSPPGIRDEVNNTFITYENLFEGFLYPSEVTEHDYTFVFQELKMGYNESKYSLDNSSKETGHYKPQDMMAKFQNTNVMPGAA